MRVLSLFWRRRRRANRSLLCSSSRWWWIGRVPSNWRRLWTGRWLRRLLRTHELTSLVAVEAVRLDAVGLWSLVPSVAEHSRTDEVPEDDAVAGRSLRTDRLGHHPRCWCQPAAWLAPSFGGFLRVALFRVGFGLGDASSWGAASNLSTSTLTSTGLGFWIAIIASTAR